MTSLKEFRLRRLTFMLTLIGTMMLGVMVPPAALGVGNDTSWPTVVRDGTWHLREAHSSGSASNSWAYGKATDYPFYGDWDGDGVATPGVYRDGNWYLRNSNSAGAADISFFYGGHTGDFPLVGDWNGDGKDTVGIIRGGEWHLVNSHRGGAADITFTYGRVDPRGSDIPLVGDWNGDRKDTVGIVRDGEWHLRNSNSAGPGQIVFTYGRVGPRGDDIAIIGDWDNDGDDTVGIVRGRTWHLRNTNTGGPANKSYDYGADSDWKSVQGGFAETTQRRIIGSATSSTDDGSNDGCHPSYPDNCFPYPPPYLNCGDITARNFRVVNSADGYDPHGFDGNKDGIGCES